MAKRVKLATLLYGAKPGGGWEFAVGSVRAYRRRRRFGSLDGAQHLGQSTAGCGSERYLQRLELQHHGQY
jgi:hypothetical protein